MRRLPKYRVVKCTSLQLLGQNTSYLSIKSMKMHWKLLLFLKNIMTDDLLCVLRKKKHKDLFLGSWSTGWMKCIWILKTCFLLYFQIMRDNNTLIIFGSRASDSGTYTCEADNGYNRDASSVSIRVENIQVSQECTDNPYFANCKLIVKAEYCTNKYYAKFCCKSCTLAGQLRGY